MWFFNSNRSVRAGIIDTRHDDLVNNCNSMFNKAASDLTKSADKLRQDITNTSDFVRKIRAIYDHLSDAVILMDHMGSILTVNHVAETMFGFTREELSGETMGILMPVDHSCRHADYVNDYMAGTANTKSDVLSRIVGHARDLMAKRRNGEVFPIELSVTEIVKDDNINPPIFVGIIRDITSRKAMEQKLQEQKQFFEKILDNLPIDVFIKNSIGEYVFANRNFCKNYGVSLSSPVFDTSMGWDCINDVRNEDANILATGTPLYVERALRGRHKFIGKSKLCTTDEDLIVGFSIDIHEQTVNNQKIFDQKMRLKSVFDNAPYGIVLVDDDGTILECNSFFESTFGSTIGKDFTELVQPENREKIKTILQNSTFNLRQLSTGLTARGEVLQCDISINPLENSNKFSWFVITIEDNSGLVEKDRHIANLTAVISHRYDRALITDVNGVIIYANPELLARYGYSADEVIGKSPNVFSSHTHNSEFFHNLWKTIQSGETWEGIITNSAKDGSLVKEHMRISKIETPSGDIFYLAVKTDLSTIK